MRKLAVCLTFLALLASAVTTAAQDEQSPLDGVYELVSSTNQGTVWDAATWRGLLIIHDGYFSRSYEALPTDGSSPSPHDVRSHYNAGTLVAGDGTLEMHLAFSSFDAISGATFHNQWELSQDGQTLTFRARDPSSDFVEVWRRRAPQ